MDEKREKVNNVSNITRCVVNAFIFLVIILAVAAMGLVVIFAENGEERNVAIYIFLIVILMLISIFAEQKLEKGGKEEIFYKKMGIWGFLYFVFIVSELIALAFYYALTKISLISENKEGIYFSLYCGIFIGTAAWVWYHLKKENADYDTLQMIIRPFVLLVTFWGYVLDKFGNYKTYAIALATLVLICSFLINLKKFKHEQKKKTANIVVEKTAAVYDVILIDSKGVEWHYKITLKD